MKMHGIPPLAKRLIQQREKVSKNSRGFDVDLLACASMFEVSGAAEELMDEQESLYQNSIAMNDAGLGANPKVMHAGHPFDVYWIELNVTESRRDYDNPCKNGFLVKTTDKGYDVDFASYFKISRQLNYLSAGTVHITNGNLIGIDRPAMIAEAMDATHKTIATMRGTPGAFQNMKEALQAVCYDCQFLIPAFVNLIGSPDFLEVESTRVKVPLFGNKRTNIDGPYIVSSTVRLPRFIRLGRQQDGNGSGQDKRWHKVRGHRRRLASGLMTWVRPHHRGNRDIGIVNQIYVMETKDEHDHEDE